MRTRHRSGRVAAAMAAAVVGVAGLATTEGTSAAEAPGHVSYATCVAHPWVAATYQAHSTPAALGALVLQCLKLVDPNSYRHDEVGLVALNSYPWFQNVNEFGLTSTVQRQLAALGMPPITLEDGPGGVITKTSPAPTQLPNELALGATFNTSLATLYGDVLGGQAKAMGYDGVQAPDLNVVRVPAWGRADESFGESPVLAGEMGAAEAVAIMSNGEIPVLKHFGPYSQDTDRTTLNQLVSQKALDEVYARPFTMTLDAVKPLLTAGGHAVAIMCSYGNVNSTKACETPSLDDELSSVGVSALVRTDLNVHVNPASLLRSDVDLIKPMDSKQLVDSLGSKAVDTALDRAVTQVFTTEFADGMVNGTVAAVRHPLTTSAVAAGNLDAQQIEDRAIVLLKDEGSTLPLRHGAGRVAVVTDGTLPSTCAKLAAGLAHALGASSCDEPTRALRPTSLFRGLRFTPHAETLTRVFTPDATGAWVAEVTDLGDTKLTMDGTTIVQTRGFSDYYVQRTSLVSLHAGVPETFRLTWDGPPPSVWLTDEQPDVTAVVSRLRGATTAVVVAYDLAREGYDRDSLELPGVQDALISAVARKVPTIVVLATDGAVTMPWHQLVDGLLEVWSPTGALHTDTTLADFVPADVAVLDGAVDPSGRLPETFPAATATSPMGLVSFWPGIRRTVNLDLAPDDGVGIGYPWYASAGWPILFPFGYGLSYTTYELTGGSLTDAHGALEATVEVRDTGGRAGTETVELYASWPTAAGEPSGLLVGFGQTTFDAAAAQSGAPQAVTIPVVPGALDVDTGGRMAIEGGAYCFEAATYDGDPSALTSGEVTLTPGSEGTIDGPASDALSEGSCG